MTPAKAALGQLLFSDPRLSGDNKRSCATCHNPALGFSDGRPRALGRNGASLRRHSPSLWNLAWARALYWDGREPTLEAQARVPISHPNEMAGDLTTAAKRLNRDARLSNLFREAFPEIGRATPDTILGAIASYERSLVSLPTRFDQWIDGDQSALTGQEYRGFLLFTGRAGCLSCHGGWRFTDDRFHDIGLPTTDLGRGALPGSMSPSAPAFKTPGLRELTSSAPYMHDGSKGTLDDVIAHYAGELIERPSLAANVVRKLKLDGQQRADLVAFLRTLSSEEPSTTGN
ncbi:MAG: cytochrome-c peroxidase [Hyphomicrobiaceae bacterium]